MCLHDSLNDGELPVASSVAEDYLIHGQGSLRVKGFLDGKERQMDMFR